MIGDVGAACFGVVVGYITYRTLARTVGKATISDIAAVVGALGGGAITKLYEPNSSGFAWYSIGLLAGMMVFFCVFALVNGKTELSHVMGLTKADAEDGLGENGPTGI